MEGGGGGEAPLLLLLIDCSARDSMMWLAFRFGSLEALTSMLVYSPILGGPLGGAAGAGAAPDIRTLVPVVAPASPTTSAARISSSIPGEATIAPDAGLFKDTSFPSTELAPVCRNIKKIGSQFIPDKCLAG